MSFQRGQNIKKTINVGLRHKYIEKMKKSKSWLRPEAFIDCVRWSIRFNEPIFLDLLFSDDPKGKSVENLKVNEELYSKEKGIIKDREWVIEKLVNNYPNRVHRKLFKIAVAHNNIEVQNIILGGHEKAWMDHLIMHRPSFIQEMAYTNYKKEFSDETIKNLKRILDRDTVKLILSFRKKRRKKVSIKFHEFH
jgi:hypothetical protein